jgi:hypothetical protein
MKRKQLELDVDFIGGGRRLTKEDELAISAFIKADKFKRANAKTRLTKKKLIRLKRRTAVAKAK